MSSIVVLEDAELVPVLELEPSTFATQTRSLPSGSCRDVPEERYRYWSESIADSGLAGVMPVQRGLSHVATSELADPPRLRRLLEVIFRERSETQSLPDPDNMLPLNGGLALRNQSQDVLIVPGCCADLGNVVCWREVVDCGQAEWQMVWIGHPWLSVMFQAPRLIISEPHESESPTARWAVSPDQLERALVAAEAELQRFAGRIASVLPSLGYSGDSKLMGQKLAGVGR